MLLSGKDDYCDVVESMTELEYKVFKWFCSGLNYDDPSLCIKCSFSELSSVPVLSSIDINSLHEITSSLLRKNITIEYEKPYPKLNSHEIIADSFSIFTSCKVYLDDIDNLIVEMTFSPTIIDFIKKYELDF